MSRNIPIAPDAQGRLPHQGGRTDVHFAGPIHHDNTRDADHVHRMAHKHVAVTADGDVKAYRSTRGFAAGNVVDGKSLHALPAVDIQPRHGGAVKGHPIAVHGGMSHVGEDGTHQTGVSRTESAAALKGGWSPTDPPNIVKKLAPAKVAWGQKSVGAEQHDSTGSQARKVLEEGHPAEVAKRLGTPRGLPTTVTEET